MPAKPKTIDDYLARVSATQRAALEKLRRDIKAAAPAAIVNRETEPMIGQRDGAGTKYFAALLRTMSPPAYF